MRSTGTTSMPSSRTTPRTSSSRRPPSKCWASRSGTIRGRATVRSYFQRALERFPNLGFELLHVLAGLDNVCLVFRSVHRGQIGGEVMFLGPDGLVVKTTVLYGPLP